MRAPVATGAGERYEPGRRAMLPMWSGASVRRQPSPRPRPALAGHLGEPAGFHRTREGEGRIAFPDTRVGFLRDVSACEPENSPRHHWRAVNRNRASGSIEGIEKPPKAFAGGLTSRISRSTLQLLRSGTKTARLWDNSHRGLFVCPPSEWTGRTYQIGDPRTTQTRKRVGE